MPLEGSSAVALRSAAGALQEAELDRFLGTDGPIGLEWSRNKGGQETWQQMRRKRSAASHCDRVHDRMLYGDENRQHYRVETGALF